jgi:hypothetical protein
MLRRGPKEDTLIGMGSNDSGVRVAGTPKDPEVGIGRSCVKKNKVG